MIWTIGNGESRSNIDIKNLDGIAVGCNAIFRDYNIRHIVCVDKRMMDEAIACGTHHSSFLYTRKDWWYRYSDNKNTRLVPELPYVGNERWDEPFQWGSGPYAVLLSAIMSNNTQVNLVGFDLYSKDKKVNNVYKDTINYDNSTKRSVDPRYWIHQIGMVFNCFPKVKFTIYQEQGWQCPKAWNYSNVTVDSISNIYYNT